MSLRVYPRSLRLANGTRCRCFIDATGQVDGIARRTNYLMNSLLSDKSRRYGYRTLPRFLLEVGASTILRFLERNAFAFTPPTAALARVYVYSSPNSRSTSAA